MSPLTSHTISFHATYDILNDGWQYIDKGTVNFTYSRLSVDYKEFRDVRGNEPAGTEPLYHLDANIYQIFISFWY